MKHLLLIVLLVTTIVKLNSQNFPITADIFRQTYLLQTSSSQGTCFLVEEENQEYLITAKHLFQNKLKNGDSTTISIYQENKLIELNVEFFIHDDNTIDIAVLKIKESLKVIVPFPIGGTVFLGQDIYFLGFPSFNNIQFSTTGTISILPLVKKAIVSGWNFTGTYTLFFLDGHNNPGFSGGPVVSYNPSTQKSEIFGVISGYYFENKPVKSNQGLNESTYIQENSGIIKCFPTEMVKQIIAAIE